MSFGLPVLQGTKMTFHTQWQHCEVGGGQLYRSSENLVPLTGTRWWEVTRYSTGMLDH